MKMSINQLGLAAVAPVLSTPLDCAYPELAEPPIPIFRQDLVLCHRLHLLSVYV